MINNLLIILRYMGDGGIFNISGHDYKLCPDNKGVIFLRKKDDEWIKGDLFTIDILSEVCGRINEEEIKKYEC